MLRCLLIQFKPPPPEPKIFSGDIFVCNHWNKSFKQFIDNNPTYSSADKIFYLSTRAGGEVSAVVDGYHSLNDDTAYDTVPDIIIKDTRIAILRNFLELATDEEDNHIYHDTASTKRRHLNNLPSHNTSELQNIKNGCPICQDDRKLYKCKKFEEITVNGRLFTQMTTSYVETI